MIRVLSLSISNKEISTAKVSFLSIRIKRVLVVMNSPPLMLINLAPTVATIVLLTLTKERKIAKELLSPILTKQILKAKDLSL